MRNVYQIYLVSDSTGETLDRIFLALKAQFKNIEYKVHPYSFTRTQNQIIKILETAKKNENSIILYTIVDNGLAKFLANQSEDKGLPCFGVLGNLILSFSKLLNQRASHQPSGQHVLNEEYYQRIEAIQFTMSHDDGNLVNEVDKSDIILLGVSRTSKTPTSIYLANKGYKTSNIPLINENSIPMILKENPKLSCVVGLNTEAQRLVDIRKNRMSSLKETDNTKYTNIDNIQKEIEEAKRTFKKYGWPSIDVTRKSVEETAASIIKIYEIYSQNNA
ncbi:kinase/pyrophosphorylase [Candidatus Pelagibacter bacterium]|nr:kinase/pyrophosphorylase [Candidatus Pelagibacter bacterium]